jgi:hypothetical protein
MRPATSRPWCICNIGTGHAADEPDNILVRVFHSVKSAYINDGPGHHGAIDLAGNVFGHGLDDRLEKSMAGIPAGVKDVFIVGHSRGAILSYLIANELFRKDSSVNVNIFNIDPVSRYAKWTKDKEVVRKNVRSVRAIVMENDNAPGIGIGNMFQLTFVKSDKATDIEYIPMPGTHGSATQVNAYNPIGTAAYRMVLRWLDDHGVPLNIQPVPDTALCDTFFEIHQRNPVRGFTASGGVASREVTDWDSKNPAPAEKASENRREMLAKAGISNPHSAGGGDKFAMPGVFINAYHSDLFQRCYPASHLLVTRTPQQLANLRLSPGVAGGLRREIGTLKSYNMTWKVLTGLGLADRLERRAASTM